MVRPYIDVSDAILDPALSGTDRFHVIRRQQVVGQNGRASTVNTYLRLLGVITPTGKNDLTRTAAFEIQAKTIDVVTRSRLFGPARDIANQQYMPDIIVWQGSHFIVTELEDYTTWGAGYVRAHCTSIDYVDPGPGVGAPIDPPLPPAITDDEGTPITGDGGAGQITIE
jgi:galactose-6-phosphate isomerase